MFQFVQYMNILLFSTILKNVMPFLFMILMCVGIQCITSMIAAILLVIPLSDINNELSWDFVGEGLFEDEEDTTVS